MSRPDRRQPKGPSLLYTMASILSVVVFAAFLLNAPQTPPPAIAEISPQAVNTITEAPSEQSGQFGSGAGEGPGGTGPGGEGPGGTTTTATTAPGPVIEENRIRNCFGTPPRQTEDPQSPPCVNYWDGDNGGATSEGVTPTQIRVAFPQGCGGTDAIKAFEAYFNRRFEFYGRKIVLIDTCNDFSGDPEPGQQQAAIKADTEHDVFASTDSEWNGGFVYRAELAKRGIVSSGHQTQYSTQDMNALPLMYQYPMANDVLFANIGEWACARLAGQPPYNPAIAPGTPGFRQDTRTFGILAQDFKGPSPVPHHIISDTLKACGHPPAHVEVVDNNDPNSNSQQNLANIVLKMKNANVTSLICLCYTLATGMAMNYAKAQAYFPEWLVSTYYLQHLAWTTSQLYPQEEARWVMGINVQPRDVNFNDDPAIQALREGAGGGFASSDWNRSAVRQQLLQNMYHDLLVIASGIQMAGPNLNPQTFDEGLRKARFPNPDHPTTPGKVGFGNGRFMTNDAAEFWWNPVAQSPYSDVAGAFCYIDGGKRHSLGTWPRGDAGFFDTSKPCLSGADPVT